MDAWKDGWIGRWKMIGWMDGWIGRWKMIGWMDRKMEDDWMDGQVDGR